MTLILGVSKADGIYLSTDFRVTDARSGRVLDDASIKFLTVRYPPDADGPTALFAYTGLAVHRADGTSIGDWLRETLRGETETFNQSVAHLRTRLDRDIAPSRIPTTVAVAVMHGSKRYIGTLTNADPETGEIMATFELAVGELSGPIAFYQGSGSKHMASHIELLKAQLAVKPRDPVEHMNLLASINRRIAVPDRRVSPFCHVSFLDAEGQRSSSRVFSKPGEVAPAVVMPFILLGIDTSVTGRSFLEDVELMSQGLPARDIDVDEMNRQLGRRP